jgi:hypothetical protein
VDEKISRNLAVRLFTRLFVMEVVDLVIDASRTQLSLGLPLSLKQNGELEVASLFGASVLWWADERKLVRIPDYYFGFTLALSEINVNPDDLHGGFLYQYMSWLKLISPTEKTKNAFEATTNADYLRRLARKSVTSVKDAANVEAILGAVCLNDTRAMFDERSHSYKRANGLLDAENDIDDGAPLHRLFTIESWSGGAWTPSDAFKSVVHVKCRNHVIASVLVAALLPFSPMPPGGSTVSNPSLDRGGVGKTFFLSDKRRAVGHLVKLGNKGVFQAIFRGTATPENFAIASVAAQLGVQQSLAQLIVHAIVNKRPVFRAGVGLLITPVATPLFHGIFGKAGMQPRADLLVRTRIQPGRSESGGADANFGCDIVDMRPESGVQYLGELGHDCSLERRFGAVTPVQRKPKPAVHAGGIAVKPKVSKKLRTLDDDSDGQSRDKRARLLTESLDFLQFVKALSAAEVNEEKIFKMFSARPDFFEVLSHRKTFGGLSCERLQQCVDIVIAAKLYRPESSAVLAYRKFIEDKV